MTEQQTFDLDLPKLSQEQMHQTLYKHIRDTYDGFLSNLNPSTARTYGWIVLKFLFTINSSNPLVLRQYNASQWDKYAEDNFEGLSPATVALRVNAIRSFFAYLINKGERKTNPLESFDLPRLEKNEEYRIVLDWNQIKALKEIKEEKEKQIFEYAYYKKSPISETGYSNSHISYIVSKIGEKIGVSGLKYSDITAAHKHYHAICPVTGQELEMTEENWMFKDGLLQARNNNKE